MKTPSKWDLTLDLVAALWALSLYGLIAYAIWRQDWTEGTFWLAFLILDRVQKLKDRE